MKRAGFLLCCMPMMLFGQQWLSPADSLHKPRTTLVVAGQAAAAGMTYVALDKLWYADHPKSDFHFQNDNAHWLQMDKAGHAFAGYQLSRISADLFRWSGWESSGSAIAGSLTGTLFLSAIEVFDGHSGRWGASWGDVGANVGGSALFLSQELLWEEQRISLKYSFHRTVYASARPEALGNGLSEEMVKDYNGQTYWLSVNARSFFKESRVPKWFNVAFGYGAEGMITAEDDLVNDVFFPDARTRQFYLSLDVDLARIETRKPWLRTLLSLFNSIKIPAPTLEVNSEGVVKFRPIYF